MFLMSLNHHATTTANQHKKMPGGNSNSFDTSTMMLSMADSGMAAFTQLQQLQQQQQHQQQVDRGAVGIGGTGTGPFAPSGGFAELGATPLPRWYQQQQQQQQPVMGAAAAPGSGSGSVLRYSSPSPSSSNSTMSRIEPSASVELQAAPVTISRSNSDTLTNPTAAGRSVPGGIAAASAAATGVDLRRSISSPPLLPSAPVSQAMSSRPAAGSAWSLGQSFMNASLGMRPATTAATAAAAGGVGGSLPIQTIANSRGNIKDSRDSISSAGKGWATKAAALGIGVGGRGNGPLASAPVASSSRRRGSISSACSSGNSSPVQTPLSKVSPMVGIAGTKAMTPGEMLRVAEALKLAEVKRERSDAKKAAKAAAKEAKLDKKRDLLTRKHAIKGGGASIGGSPASASLQSSRRASALGGEGLAPQLSPIALLAAAAAAAAGGGGGGDRSIGSMKFSRRSSLASAGSQRLAAGEGQYSSELSRSASRSRPPPIRISGHLAGDLGNSAGLVAAAAAAGVTQQVGGVTSATVVTQTEKQQTLQYLEALQQQLVSLTQQVQRQQVEAASRDVSPLAAAYQQQQQPGSSQVGGAATAFAPFPGVAFVVGGPLGARSGATSPLQELIMGGRGAGLLSPKLAEQQQQGQVASVEGERSSLDISGAKDFKQMWKEIQEQKQLEHWKEIKQQQQQQQRESLVSPTAAAASKAPLVSCMGPGDEPIRLPAGGLLRRGSGRVLDFTVRAVSPTAATASWPAAETQSPAVTAGAVQRVLSRSSSITNPAAGGGVSLGFAATPIICRDSAASSAATTPKRYGSFTDQSKAESSSDSESESDGTEQQEEERDLRSRVGNYMQQLKQQREQQQQGAGGQGERRYTPGYRGHKEDAAGTEELPMAQSKFPGGAKQQGGQGPLGGKVAQGLPAGTLLANTLGATEIDSSMWSDERSGGSSPDTSSAPVETVRQQQATGRSGSGNGVGRSHGIGSNESRSLSSYSTEEVSSVSGSRSGSGYGMSRALRRLPTPHASRDGAIRESDSNAQELSKVDNPLFSPGELGGRGDGGSQGLGHGGSVEKPRLSAEAPDITLAGTSAGGKGLGSRSGQEAATGGARIGDWLNPQSNYSPKPSLDFGTQYRGGGVSKRLSLHPHPPSEPKYESAGHTFSLKPLQTGAPYQQQQQQQFQGFGTDTSGPEAFSSQMLPRGNTATDQQSPVQLSPTASPTHATAAPQGFSSSGGYYTPPETSSAGGPAESAGSISPMSPQGSLSLGQSFNPWNEGGRKQAVHIRMFRTVSGSMQPMPGAVIGGGKSATTTPRSISPSPWSATAVDSRSGATAAIVRSTSFSPLRDGLSSGGGNSPTAGTGVKIPDSSRSSSNGRARRSASPWDKMKNSALVQKLSDSIKSAVKGEKALRGSGDGGILGGVGSGGEAGRKSLAADISVKVSDM